MDQQPIETGYTARTSANLLFIAVEIAKLHVERTLGVQFKSTLVALVWNNGLYNFFASRWSCLTLQLGVSGSVCQARLFLILKQDHSSEASLFLKIETFLQETKFITSLWPFAWLAYFLITNTEETPQKQDFFQRIHTRRSFFPKETHSRTSLCLFFNHPIWHVRVCTYDMPQCVIWPVTVWWNEYQLTMGLNTRLVARSVASLPTFRKNVSKVCTLVVRFVTHEWKNNGLRDTCFVERSATEHQVLSKHDNIGLELYQYDFHASFAVTDPCGLVRPSSSV